MKSKLLMCLSVLLVCSSVASAAPRRSEQQTPERPRRVQLQTGSFLGVELSEVSKETVARLKLRAERGALIEGVTSGSSAAQAGLQKNDVIVKWDGEPIESAREMSRQIRETPPGRLVRLTVMRDGRELEINVTLGKRRFVGNLASVVRPAIATVRARPAIQVSRLQDRARLGVELQGMTPQLAEYFGLSKRSGALVIFVFADSPAAKAGLKAGDVILSAGGETVDNPLDLRRALINKSEGSVEFKIQRDKREQTLRVQLEKGSSSWLLSPDDSDGVVRLAISPMSIEIPKFSLAPTAITVPGVNLKPMKIQIPTIEMAPIAIPQINLAPVAMPQINLAPMKVEIPKVNVEPVKILIVPRRIVL